jgi:hypothetical protein
MGKLPDWYLALPRVDFDKAEFWRALGGPDWEARHAERLEASARAVLAAVSGLTGLDALRTWLDALIAGTATQKQLAAAIDEHWSTHPGPLRLRELCNQMHMVPSLDLPEPGPFNSPGFYSAVVLRRAQELGVDIVPIVKAVFEAANNEENHG